jgi:hypothetical protein
VVPTGEKERRVAVDVPARRVQLGIEAAKSKSGRNRVCVDPGRGTAFDLAGFDISVMYEVLSSTVS